MAAVDLQIGEVHVAPQPAGKTRVVKLGGGPCAGRHERVGAHAPECWARVGKPGGHGVETQMWARYDRTPDGRYLYSGVTVSTFELERGLRDANAAGETYEEAYGA